MQFDLLPLEDEVELTQPHHEEIWANFLTRVNKKGRDCWQMDSVPLPTDDDFLHSDKGLWKFLGLDPYAGLTFSEMGRRYRIISRSIRLDKSSLILPPSLFPNAAGLQGNFTNARMRLSNVLDVDGKFTDNFRQSQTK